MQSPALWVYTAAAVSVAMCIYSKGQITRMHCILGKLSRQRLVKGHYSGTPVRVHRGVIIQNARLGIKIENSLFSISIATEKQSTLSGCGAHRKGIKYTLSRICLHIHTEHKPNGQRTMRSSRLGEYKETSRPNFFFFFLFSHSRQPFFQLFASLPLFSSQRAVNQRKRRKIAQLKGVRELGSGGENVALQ